MLFRKLNYQGGVITNYVYRTKKRYLNILQFANNKVILSFIIKQLKRIITIFKNLKNPERKLVKSCQLD